MSRSTAATVFRGIRDRATAANRPGSGNTTRASGQQVKTSRSQNRTFMGGSARLSTISGSVAVDAFPALDAMISLHSVSGHVSCDFPVTISEQKNNRLEGKIGAGAATVDAGTISGSIRIGRK